MRKADGSLRLCIVCRGLNEVTRKNAYPLPLVDETLDGIKDVNIYTHLDLASGFKQVRVRDEDVHTTALQTHDGLMECVAMLFGVCNGPPILQRMMNNILRDILTKFVTVYLDDAFVYSRNVEEPIPLRSSRNAVGRLASRDIGNNPYVDVVKVRNAAGWVHV
jgi:hypothetical protein